MQPANPIEQIVTDLERHAGAGGWDLPPRLYALVGTSELLDQDPDLAERLGIPPDARADAGGEEALVALEQPELPSDQRLEDLLPTVAWPSGVTGCALVVERVVLPDDAEDDLPADADPGEWAANHPQREDVRLVAGVLRDGTRHMAMRMRNHDSADQVLSGADLVPGLTEALGLTLQD